MSLRFITVFLAGLLMPLSFAPINWGPVSVLALAFLFYQWQQGNARQAWWLGWVFGTAMFLGGVYWVYVSMHDFGYIPVFFAALLTLLFALFLGLFPAVVGWLSLRYFHVGKGLQLWLVFPLIWVLFEWIRSWLFTGFPWLNIGVSQVGWPLMGYAPLFGEYGMSWLVALTASAIVFCLDTVMAKRILTVVLLGLCWLAGGLLNEVEWTEAQGEPFEVALVQADVDQEKKWNPDFREEIISSYLEQTQPYWGVDVIIWPETAISAFYDHVPDIVDGLEQRARQFGSDMLVGIPSRDIESGDYYNSILSLGEERGLYHKRHLVPFGEFIPFQAWISDVLDFMGLPMSGFSRGSAQQSPLMAGGYLAGLTVCYEIIFNSEVIQSLPEAHYLVNVSNNTWFGDSSMPHQQLQMAQLRARETERYVLSATNNGVSAVVDSRGVILSVSPRGQKHVLREKVQARSGATPYVYWGNYLVLTFIAIGILWLLFSHNRPNKSFS